MSNPEAHSSSSTQESQSEWNLGEIYSKAYRIARNNPVLWWFAIAAAATSSYNGGSGGGSGSSSSHSEKVIEHSNEQGSLMLTQVLGDTTSATADLFSQIIQAIPWYFYVILGVEFLLLLIVMVISGVVYRAWAEAALLEGIETAMKDEKPLMEDMSEKAFPLIKSFVWLQIVPGLVFWLIGLTVIGVMAVGIFVAPAPINFILGATLFFGVILFLIALLFLTMVMIWAPRKVVVEKMSATHAFKTSFRIAKKKFWKTLGYGICNNLVQLGVMMVAIGVPVIILLILGFAGFATLEHTPALGGTLLGITGLLVVILIVAITLLGGIITTWKAAVWSIAYQKIRGKYDH